MVIAKQFHWTCIKIEGYSVECTYSRKRRANPNKEIVT